MIREPGLLPASTRFGFLQPLLREASQISVIPATLLREMQVCGHAVWFRTTVHPSAGIAEHGDLSYTMVNIWEGEK